MEERSLRVYGEKTFFSKITNTITKLLIPTKVGINGVLISIKRNNVLKAYESYEDIDNISNEEKKENIRKKFDDAYALYLESIDKYIMDSIYKKVRNGSATEFEENALSRYYSIVHIKEKEYLEYKYRKQMYLLGLDYETVVSSKKPQLVEKYKTLYFTEMESLYKGLLKHFSIKLADNLTQANKEEIYNKIFEALEEYIENILPLKFEKEKDEKYKEIIDEYENYERFSVGKLDQNDNIEKNMLLLGLSRKLFTHSLPLIVAEQCYEKLLRDLRSLIVDTKIIKKQEKAYSLLIKLIEEYNIKLLSTKIYWDKPEMRDEYKIFWDKYKNIENLKNINNEEYIKQKQILFIKDELKKVLQDENKYYKIIQFYKAKLVELGVMRNLTNSYAIITGTFKKKTTNNTKILQSSVAEN